MLKKDCKTLGARARENMLALALLTFASPLAAWPQGRSQNLTLRIPPVKTTLQVENQPVVITAWGTVAMVSAQRERVVFRLQLLADLANFQKNATAILASQLNKSDRCGERIEIQNATLSPAEPASIMVAQLHYERYVCAKIFGKQSAHRLVAGNAVVQMKLTPMVEDGRTVRLQPELGTIQADGSLGELLRQGPIEQMLREKMSQALLSATQKGTNFSETLPPAAQGFATIQNVRFTDLGAGRLAVVLDGDLHITSAQAQLLKDQLQERAQKPPATSK